MAKVKKFVTASIEPKGRPSMLLGERTHKVFENDSFRVEYAAESGKLREPDRLYVTVTIRDHGDVSWQCLAIPPSPSTARIHAGTAFRSHFGVNSGEPSDFDNSKGDILSKLVDECPCLDI